MKNVEQLCISKNNKKVFYDPVGSHAATHFDDTPNLKEIVSEIVSGMDLTDEIVAKEFDMNRPVGDCDVVEIDESDVIVYAMRKNREDQGRVPFTKSRSTTPSSLVSVYLVQESEDSYELSSAWIGELDSPPFPEMENATNESIPYWSKRAFVWVIVPKCDLWNSIDKHLIFCYPYLCHISVL